MPEPQPRESTQVPWESYKLGIVRCDHCGKEWHDMDAALDGDGQSDRGCPNGCRSLTTPVFNADGSYNAEAERA